MYLRYLLHSSVDTPSAFAIVRGLFRGMSSGETCLVNVVT
jgi:hypothetical protein